MPSRVRMASMPQYAGNFAADRAALVAEIQDLQASGVRWTPSAIAQRVDVTGRRSQQSAQSP